MCQGMYQAPGNRKWCVEIAASGFRPGDEVFLGAWPDELMRLRLYTAAARDAAISQRTDLRGNARTPYLTDLQCLADCTATTLGTNRLLKIPAAVRPAFGSKPPFDLVLCGLGQYVELMETHAYEAERGRAAAQFARPASSRC